MAVEVPIILEQPIAAILANGDVDPEIMWVERNMAVMDLRTRRRISYLNRKMLPHTAAATRDLKFCAMLGDNLTHPLTSINLATTDLRDDELTKELTPEFMAVYATGREVCTELVENKGVFILDDRVALQALENMVYMAQVRVMLDDVPKGHNTWDNMMRLIARRRELLYGIKLIADVEEDDGLLRRATWATQHGLRVVIEMIKTQAVLDRTMALLTSAGVNLGLVYLQGDRIGKQELVSKPPEYQKDNSSQTRSL